MAKPKSAYMKRVDALFAGSRVKEYPKHQLIHYAGDPLTNISLITKGFVKAYTILDSGDTRTLLLLGPGDIFPIAFSTTMDWDNYQLKSFYQSLTEVEVKTIPQDVFKKHIENDLVLMNTYITYMSATNNAIMNQLEVMKNKKAINKVTMLLPYIVSKFGKRIRPHTYQLGFKLSHQEVADLSGVTRETTTTLLHELEKDGIIEQKRGNWIVHLKASEEELLSD